MANIVYVLATQPTSEEPAWAAECGAIGTILTSNGPGRIPSFQNVGVGGTPAAPVNSIQFNGAGLFSGSANFLFDGTSIVTLGSTANGTLIAPSGALVTSSGAQMFIRGGPGGTTSGNGGAVQIVGGIPTDGTGGGVAITASAGATISATNRTGGLIAITSGAGTLGGNGGALTLTSGAAGATGAGGAFTLTSGIGGATSGNSGNFTLGSGDSAHGNTGSFTLKTGSAATGVAGNIIIGRLVSGAAAAFSQGIFFRHQDVDYVVFDALGNFVFDPQPAFTSASNDGFLWTPQAAGTPTGTPTVYNSDYGNSCPVYIDKTAMGIFLYDFAGAAWRFVSPTVAGAMVRTPVAWTNGAGAAAGTLLNAPAPGNPTKWIPVNDNGTTRFIPAW